MSSLAASAPYTWDDFVALEEDDQRELIDGELVEVGVPTGLHEYIVWPSRSSRRRALATTA
jgi:Uma2 family endonuclease